MAGGRGLRNGLCLFRNSCMASASGSPPLDAGDDNGFARATKGLAAFFECF